MTVTALARDRGSPRCFGSQISVRNATTADASTVLDIWLDGSGPHERLPSMDGAVEWIAAHQRGHRPLWLALMDGKPVGLTSFLGFCDRPGCDATSELSIHVRGSRRGHGIGRALVTRAIAAAPFLGFDRYAAYVGSDDAAGVALFCGRGFRAWGVMPGATQAAGRRFDLLLFGLDLAKA